MLAALVAVFLQALVVQTHVDGFAGFGRAEIQLSQHASQNVPALKAPATKPDATCPICQVAATAGRTLLATVATVAARPPTQYAAPLVRVLAFAAQPSHAWQSRAPPHAS
ncbi:MAG: hypothetical protein QM759_05680 [Terricaulis sp.]